MRIVTRIGMVGVALALLGPAPALAQRQCEEDQGPTPGEGELRELGANAQRPTFTIPLDSGKEADDDITLPVREDQTIGFTPEAATARVEVPRKEGRKLKADISVAAQPTELGSEVRVFACISNKEIWEAGTYEGTVQVYGPRLARSAYPLVVTTKWPIWVPLAVIVGVLAAFLAFEVARSETGLKGDGVYLIIAVPAGAVTYFAQYNSIDTWGSEPETQLTGLAVAVVTAAAAGRAAAKKFFGD
jgi:hypothetical protein